MILLLCLFSFESSLEIPIYVGKIISPTSSAYQYDAISFPICQIRKITQENSNLTFSQKFMGQTTNDVGIKIQILENITKQHLCQRGISQSSYERMKTAISNNCWIQFIVGKHITYSYLGSNANSTISYFSLWTFNIYQTKRTKEIYYVSAISSDPKPLISDEDISFSYTVNWHIKNDDTQKAIEAQKLKQIDLSSFNWYHLYSLLKLIVIFFSVFVVFSFIIIRKISSDVSNFNQEGMFDDFSGISDYSWKSLHGDIFRKPKNLKILSALIGSSFQISYTFVFLSLLNGVFHNITESFSLKSLFTVIYIASSALSGFMASIVSIEFGDSNYIFPSILSSLCLALPSWIVLFLSSFFDNPIVAPRICIVLLITLFFVILPLTVFGGYLGYSTSPIENPCEVAVIPKKVTNLPIYLRSFIIYPICGLLSSFLMIYEVDNLLLTLYQGNTKWFLTFLGIILFFTFVNVAVVSVCYTYLLLQNVSYHWQWPSFMAPVCSAAFVFIYILNLIGRMSTFASWQELLAARALALCGSVIFGFICGGFGFVSSNIFIQTIFTQIKSE